MGKAIAASLITLLLASCVETKSGPKVYASEPKKGKIKSGINVLVDDGSCAAGQIKQVTGGSIKFGIDRKYACIPRPADLPKPI